MAHFLSVAGADKFGHCGVLLGPLGFDLFAFWEGPRNHFHFATKDLASKWWNVVWRGITSGVGSSHWLCTLHTWKQDLWVCRLQQRFWCPSSKQTAAFCIVGLVQHRRHTRTGHLSLCQNAPSVREVSLQLNTQSSSNSQLEVGKLHLAHPSSSQQLLGWRVCPRVHSICRLCLLLWDLFVTKRRTYTASSKNVRGADCRWHGYPHLLIYYRYLRCKSELKTFLEIFTHGQRVSRASVQQSICGSLTIMHKQQVQLSKEQEHESVSGIHCMWSKGERSAQTLGLLGVILGVTILMLGQSTTDERSDARVGTRISTLKRVASQLNTSLEICAGLAWAKPV